MYRLFEIKEGLKNLIGWKPDYGNQVTENLMTSESGMYFNEQHPLLRTYTNIKAIVPKFYEDLFTQWNFSKTYLKGQYVRYETLNYIALQTNINKLPTDSEYWKPYSVFEAYLSEQIYTGISNVMQRFFNQKKIDIETKSILERRVLLDGAGRLNDFIQNRHKIVGYEITPVNSMGLTVQIESIGTQFAGAVGNLRLYIFHSSRVDAVKVIDVEIDERRTFKWNKQIDLYLPYMNNEENAGGSWYICYNQDDLPSGMQAINIDRDLTKDSCKPCGNNNIFNLFSKYVEIQPFEVQAPTTFADFPEMWDIRDNIYHNRNNFGLNLEISVKCDITDLIIQQRSIFQEALGLQVASNILKEILYNPESNVNRHQVNVLKSDLMYELDGTMTGKPSGIGMNLDKAYKALMLDTNNLDRICLKCHNGGVNYTGSA